MRPRRGSNSNHSASAPSIRYAIPAADPDTRIIRTGSFDSPCSARNSNSSASTANTGAGSTRSTICSRLRLQPSSPSNVNANSPASTGVPRKYPALESAMPCGNRPSTTRTADTGSVHRADTGAGRAAAV